MVYGRLNNRATLNIILQLKKAIIIQVRSDSLRFPRKAYQIIEGKPVLWHVINRCKEMGLLIIVATTDRLIDDPIIEIAKNSNVEYFQGSVDDVLDRYYHAAQAFSVDIIVRVTADCPLIDPRHSLRVLPPIERREVDYAGLDMTSFPDGLDTEAFTFHALETAWKNARLKSEREHVTPYIHKHPAMFRIKSVSSGRKLDHLRWTVDYPDDLEFVRAVYSELGQRGTFYMEDVLTLLASNPELSKINASHTRNEGYVKSLSEDRYLS